MFTTRPELAGTFGMVASTHWLASQAGMAVLEQGGNAVDAAVAAGFVLQVVEPHLNGPGGDMSLLFRSPDGAVTVLCGQGPAPAAASAARVRGLGLTAVPGTGWLSAAVPGATPAWLTLLRDHGTRTPAEVLGFAIGYAEAGHPVLPAVSATVGRMAEMFVRHWPTSAATWLPPPAPGSLMASPALATTYRRLTEAGGAASTREAACDAALDAWTTGFVAEAVADFVRTPVYDSSGREHAGLLTADDLAGWRPGYEAPMRLPWHGGEVAKCGSWSQGPALLEMLALLDPVVDAGPELLDAELIHQVVEVEKLALADRDAWFGDGADLTGLLDEDFLTARRQLVGPEASRELRPGRLGGRLPRLPALGDEMGDLTGRGEPTVGPPGGDTCHLDVVDRWGTVVSATPSGGWLQSSPTIPELGFCLGTRLQMTWLEEGLPATLRPGRRPRTTLSPTIATGPLGTVTGFGTPGGDQQEQWQLLFWLRHAVAGLDLQAAIDAPTFHTTGRISSFDPRTWEPAGLEIERRVPASVRAELVRRGHRVNVADDWQLGRLSAVSWDPQHHVVRAAANPRGMSGYAVGR